MAISLKLNELLCYRLFNVVKLNEQLIGQRMDPFHLSKTQWKIMARFNFLTLPCTQQDMLSSMGIDRGHLTRALEQLEKRELIRKERLRHDKRAFNLFLTNKGKSLLKKIEQALVDESAALMNGLSEKENLTLSNILTKLEKTISAELESP